MSAMNIARVFNNAVHDLHQLGECKSMLVSPQLRDGFCDKLIAQTSAHLVLDGTIYFKGIPVAVCDQLHDLEYAFVK